MSIKMNEFNVHIKFISMDIEHSYLPARIFLPNFFLYQNFPPINVNPFFAITIPASQGLQDCNFTNISS